MVTELIPLQLAFRGLSDEDEEDPTVINSPDIDEEDEEDADDDASASDDTGNSDDDSAEQ